ncbi:MAG: M23 family metallopeptidase [Armatimonadetes bacterium]|nr:peptidoglycan DD-metalloendopeptidase family protein [Armatimonadota bacterium]MBS1700588.1 M23 family metallopeptidase [Armatimonadota bacterium]MBS1728927.1 M23 family metallopeptidase [Armatimonadota bacterium]
MIGAFIFATAQTWAAYGKFPPPVAPFVNHNLPLARVHLPMVFPLIGSCSYNDDYNTQRSGFHHTAIDIRARKMTPIVAPISGVVGFKVHTFWIYGSDGWKVLGTHLNDDTPGTNDGKDNFDFMFAPNLRFGDHVQSGQLIGYVGDSGDATGPHLHFELFSPKGIRNPYPSLKAAMKTAWPVRIIRNLEAAPESGQERYEVCKRNWVHLTGSFYGMLTAKQYDNGRVITTKSPSFVTFKFPQDLVDQIDVDSWPTDRPASIYFRREGDQTVVTKIVQPDN